MSDSLTRARRLSASAINTLQECSLRYYYGSVLKVPQSSHPKSVIGSMVHKVLEVLRQPRHRHIYDLITEYPFEYTRSPALWRMILRWQTRHGLDDTLMESVNEMLRVGLTDINYFHNGAIRVFDPEHEFTMDIGTPDAPCIVRGYIDSMAEYEDGYVIIDFKSQATKYPKVKLPSLIQAIVYQLYVWRTFQRPARVEFVMLRHSPTSKTPDKHLQVVQPASPAQLAGFESYLRSLFVTINDFGLEEAMANPCSDSFFCQRICPYLRPFDYYATVKKDDPTQSPIKTFPLDKMPQPEYADEAVIKVRHGGCAFRWTE